MKTAAPPLALLLALALVAGCQPDASAGTAGEGGADAATVDDDQPIVEIASAKALVDDLDGVDADWVVLNFWATWCGPCRVEFPDFTRYDEEMDGQGVDVRFVSLDDPRELAAVRAFLAEHEVEDPSYLYTGQGDVTSELNPFVGAALPITMVLDADRIVQHTHVGLLRYPELKETVATIRAGGTPSDS
ncbi:TlpA disulfide reductase family protein [Rubrivirga sp. S365]|uniref:TlpA disulfide reductase family protein n=1 Tax=Rubrivirga litoralis TaxID=3075598 RepID=A0ABU3BTM7_9BACT|nr:MULTISPECIES: TlpA disulfide reductase family protein [unclassified Rubrivirga]MDT0632526.1 TlpA disulfide reductase family protein [Rubrivirga sp. F394]MDT7856991.1 TlpA disulfide reductase family protein [Rubrivirga sp. S365]